MGFDRVLWQFARDFVSFFWDFCKPWALLKYLLGIIGDYLFVWGGFLSKSMLGVQLSWGFLWVWGFSFAGFVFQFWGLLGGFSWFRVWALLEGGGFKNEVGEGLGSATFGPLGEVASGLKALVSGLESL